MEYEIIGNKILLRFHENISEATETSEHNSEETFISWESDRYTITRLYDSGILDRIEDDLAGWINMAREEEEIKIASEIRFQRNNLLQATDPTQLADSPLSPEQLAAYRVYRQALRDLPQQGGFPYNVDFPQMPGS